MNMETPRLSICTDGITHLVVSTPEGPQELEIQKILGCCIDSKDGEFSILYETGEFDGSEHPSIIPISDDPETVVDRLNRLRLNEGSPKWEVTDLDELKNKIIERIERIETCEQNGFEP